MEFMKHFSFRTKIILICITVLILNSSISGGIYYSRAFQDTLENYYSSSEDMVSQMRMYLTNETQSVTKRVHAMYGNMNFFNQMTQYFQHQDPMLHVRMMGNVADIISEISQGDRYIHSISIESEFGSFDNFSRIRNHDFHFMESEMKAYFDRNPNETICWYPAMPSPLFVEKEIVIPVVYKFRFARKDAYVVVSLQQSEIDAYLKEVYNSYDKIFIADRDGNSIINCGEQEAKLLKEFSEEDLKEKNAICKEIQLDGETYLATCTQMKGTGWKICALRSAGSLVENLDRLRYSIIGVICLCAAFSIFAIVVFAHTMTAPLGRLAVLMNYVTKTEDFHSYFYYPNKDEIGALGTSFNFMIAKINSLLEQLNGKIEELKREKELVKMVQNQKRKAELKALQAQINPHFLYNTLNAITWQAVRAGATEVGVLSNSLGKFFRISLSRGKEVITIGDELEHVENYLRIQEIRYKDKIRYEILASEDIREKYIIKLVLQPLVENAIYHGLKVKEGLGMIRIQVKRSRDEREGQVIRITVEDNGEGIEEERLKTIQKNLKNGCVYYEDGYGIYNVNERLKLYYGDAYGLELESVYKQGTRALITIPVRTTDGE